MEKHTYLRPWLVKTWQMSPGEPKPMLKCTLWSQSSCSCRICAKGLCSWRPKSMTCPLKGQTLAKVLSTELNSYSVAFLGAKAHAQVSSSEPKLVLVNLFESQNVHKSFFWSHNTCWSGCLRAKAWAKGHILEPKLGLYVLFISFTWPSKHVCMPLGLTLSGSIEVL